MPVGCHASHFDPIGDIPPVLDGLPLMAGDRVGLISNFDAASERACSGRVRSTYFGPSGMGWAIVCGDDGSERSVAVIEMTRLEGPP